MTLPHVTSTAAASLICALAGCTALSPDRSDDGNAAHDVTAADAAAAGAEVARPPRAALDGGHGGKDAASDQAQGPSDDSGVGDATIDAASTPPSSDGTEPCTRGQDCEPGSCADGCGPQSCCATDGEGGCCAQDGDCDGGFACRLGGCSCASACPADGDRSPCAAGRVCLNGRCEPLSAPGTACEAGFECETGQCVDGVCCDRACDEECFSCGTAGLCAPDSAGTACGDDATDLCDLADSCDGQGACIDRVAAQDAVCRPADPDSPQCDVPERCDGEGKACPPDRLQPAGTACGSASSTACDAPDSCDAQGQCVDRVDPSSTLCRPADSARPECDAPEYCDGTTKPCPVDGARPDGTDCSGEPGKCCGGQCATGGMVGADLAAACRTSPQCIGTGSYGYAPDHQDQPCGDARCSCTNCNYASTCAQTAGGRNECTQQRCQAGSCADAEVVDTGPCTCQRDQTGAWCDVECSGGVEPVCFGVCCDRGSCSASCGAL